MGLHLFYIVVIEYYNNVIKKSVLRIIFEILGKVDPMIYSTVALMIMYLIQSAF